MYRKVYRALCNKTTLRGWQLPRSVLLSRRTFTQGDRNTCGAPTKGRALRVTCGARRSEFGATGRQQSESRSSFNVSAGSTTVAVRRGRRRGADETPVARRPSPATSVLDAPPATNGNGSSSNGSSSNGASANGRAAVATAPVAAPTGRPRLGDLLVERESITREQLEEALLAQTKSGVRLGEILVAAGALDESQLAEMLASQFQLPLADLRRERPDPEVLGAISESVARGLQVVPLRKVDGVLEMLVADPAWPDLRAELERTTKSKVAFYVASPSDVRSVIDQSYRALAGVAAHIKEFEITSSARRRAGSRGDRGRRRTRRSCRSSTRSSPRRCATAPPTCTSSRRTTRCACASASTARCTTSSSCPAEMGPALVSRIKIMADMNIVERRRPQDGQFEMNDRRPRRSTSASSTTPTIWGEKTVLRLLDRTPLALHARRPRHAARRRTRSTRGSSTRRSAWSSSRGPTGSGKTTTLYATLGGDQPPRHQRDDDRRPGRVHLPDGQPDPDQRAART